MKDIVAMIDGTILVNVHTADRCKGEWCCIHNPSPHHMTHWDPNWDNHLKQMWRVCPHGYLHPDPDEMGYWRRRWSHRTAALLGLHSCDGCCQPDIEPPLKPVVPPPAELLP